jgi:hypothetical protein
MYKHTQWNIGIHFACILTTRCIKACRITFTVHASALALVASYTPHLARDDAHFSHLVIALISN